MENLSTSRVANESNGEKVKAHSQDYTNSRGSQEFNHQRVSVREIIEDHYRRGR